MSGAKFGRSIMGLAGEVANPITQHRPAPLVSVSKARRSTGLDTARIKKAPPAGGAKGLILMHR